jgi:phosphopantetheinyl transferase (holo-ACP synthase)
MPNHLMRFTWHDAIMTKVDKRPTLCHTPEIEKAWKEAGMKGDFPNLHVSITHDGDYLTAFVIAEQG